MTETRLFPRIPDAGMRYTHRLLPAHPFSTVAHGARGADIPSPFPGNALRKKFDLVAYRVHEIRYIPAGFHGAT